MAAAATAEAPAYIHPIETGEPLEQNVLDARILYDREQIELEAQSLIESRAKIDQSEVFAQEYKNNSRTAIMEALTESGHLSRVVLSGSLEEIEAQMLSRLLNGWDDNLPKHEKDRRFAELCNVLYGQKVRSSIAKGELPANTAILEISDYPEPLAGTKLGYRDKNKKGMVRSSHLIVQDDGEYELVIEQVSRSNATSHSTFAFLNSCGVGLEASKPADLSALERPVLYNVQDYSDGVVDIMRTLDRYSGPDVIYGEKEIDEIRHVDYKELREESLRREQEVDVYIEGLAKLEEQLDNLVKKGMTLKEKADNYNGEIVRILAAICTLEPTYAKATFGEQAAPSFYKAAVLTAQGRNHEAQQVLNSAAHLRDAVVFCGATISLKEAQDQGLEVNSYGELVNKGKEGWTWKDGVCVVKSCSTRPAKTKVGPCSVCRSCQAKFDRGKDPTKEAAHNIQRKRDEHSIGKAVLGFLERKRDDH